MRVGFEMDMRLEVDNPVKLLKDGDAFRSYKTGLCHFLLPSNTVYSYGVTADIDLSSCNVYTLDLKALATNN